MAVELAKLSIWLFTMDPGRPLSFVDHHLKCGHALLGSQTRHLGQLPSPGAPKLRSDPAQGNLFEPQFRAKLPIMLRDVFRISTTATTTLQDVADKKLLDDLLADFKRPFLQLADLWLGVLFGEDASDYFAMLANIDSIRDRTRRSRGYIGSSTGRFSFLRYSLTVTVQLSLMQGLTQYLATRLGARPSM